MQPQMALSKDFMEAYSRLPRAQQKKVREFTEKFRRDPTQSGINFETIAGAADDKVRSVRIDQAYRAIVIHPPKGDVYLLVWVDHHDDAYAWVRNKRFEVNPLSGSLQLFEVVPGEVVEEVPSAAATAAAAPEPEVVGLFEGVDDEDLIFAGVPEPLLASVRALRTDDDLEALAPHLPEDAAEILFLLAAGYDLMTALEESDRSKTKPPAVDTEDFSVALEHPQSQRVFKVVDTERELQEMLDAPLEKWRIFLHPSQRRLVEMNANGPVRVLGGAGTGKTVVLMHRARHLARKVFFEPNDRLLVTTFSRNLALDLAMNLRNLCAGEYERLEIANLHSWAVGLMRRHGHGFQVVSERDRRDLFNVAVVEGRGEEFPASFYREEWVRVIQAQDVTSRDEYLTARRTGRGTRLSRKQRAGVWEVLRRYRELLQEKRQVEWQDVIRETRLFIEKQGIASPYRAVLADEVQDFTPNDLRLLRALAPDAANSLFLVGDGHQRIYNAPTRLSAYGIEIRGRSRRLKLNYRTTAQIRTRAVAILENCDIDDLDGERDTLKGYHSLRQGPEPRIQHFTKEADEAKAITQQLKAWLEEVPAESICIAARTEEQIRDRYEPLLEREGIPHLQVKTDPETEATQPGIRLATMHRMKGLEFPRVILAGVQKGRVPLELPGPAYPDEASRADHELQERCLLYVASTRARDELLIVGFGDPSPFLSVG